MAITAQEFWKGTNGDAWPVGNWHNPTLYPTSSHAATIDIQSNVGRLLPSTADATPASGIFLRRAPVQNCEIALTYDQALNTGQSVAIISLRASLDMDANARPTNSVNLLIDRAAQTVTVDKEVAGVNTSLSGAVAFTITSGTPVSIRFRVVGPSIKAKWWTSTNEPSAWNYETNDGTTVFPGYVGLMHLNDAGGNSAKYTNFSYTDLTPAPPLLLARLKRRFQKPIKPPHVVVSWSGQGTLQTDGTFAGTSTVGHKSAGTLATDGAFTGAGKITHKAAGTLSTGGTFTGAGVVTHKSAGTLTTNGTFTGAGKIVHKSAGTLATDGTFTGAGKITHKTAGALATDGTFSSATGLIGHKSAGTLQTDGTFTGAGVIGAGTTPPVTTPEEPQHGGLGRRGPYTPVEQMRHKQLLVREDEELMVLM